jgi:hypothetical protein
VFAGVYAAFVVLFFTARFIHPRLNFPEDVVARQEAFLHLGGGSAVTVQALQPSVQSFLLNAPQAFTLSTIRPYPSDVHHLLSLAAAIEINFLLLLAVVCLLFRKKLTADPVVLFLYFFSLSVLLMIGYTVNILGAVVRYRSIVLSLLLIPIVAQANWRRIGQLIGGNMEDKKI